VKLLFDENLSPRLPRLPRLPADNYADSIHVREVGLRDADDHVIWEYDKLYGLTIVSGAIQAAVSRRTGRGQPSSFALRDGSSWRQRPDGRQQTAGGTRISPKIPLT
jgi:predicted nuclease of predicted toxin-antitoxin system